MATTEVPGENDASVSDPGFMLWQITNAWQRAMRAALAPVGLTYVQILLLAGLRDRLALGTQVSQASLAHALGTDPMMTSQVLRTLEAAGLVKRQRNPTDSRARVLALTDEGRGQLAAALPLIAAVDTQFFEALGRREERFMKAMKRLWRSLRQTTPSSDEAAEAEPGPAVDPSRKKRAGGGKKRGEA